MSLPTLINSVRRYLQSQYMFVDDEWLAECVEFLYEDQENNNTEAVIKEMTKEQWLLNDLKAICPGSLPANLKNQHKTVLTGRFVLQINAAIDIGTPAYQQYLKLQKVNMENVEATTKYEDKVSNHRMIKLSLTDGVQEVSGIEFRPMRNLSCDITPGCKVLIKGPVECRRGTLLLTENTIELLGGEVKEIVISNSLAGLLSSKLGVTITQGVEPELRTDTRPTQHIEVTPVQQISEPTLAPIYPTTHHEQARPTLPPTYPAANQQARPILEQTYPSTNQHQASFVDDDIDVAQLAELEAEFTENVGKRSINSNVSNPEKKLKLDTGNKPEDYPDDDDNDDLFDEDLDHLRELEAQMEARENELNSQEDKGPNSEPFVYIKQIQEISEMDRNGKVFKVKAQIMTLLSKLSVGKEGWSLKCTIVDGTGRLDVEFTSDVLSKIVGLTPQQMNAMKKKMATDPELNQKIVSAIRGARDKLQVMYCIIELTMLEVPKITDYKIYDSTHVEQLKRRVTSYS